MKRILALSLTLTLAFGALTSCNSSPAESSSRLTLPPQGREVTLLMFLPFLWKKLQSGRQPSYTMTIPLWSASEMRGL